jgi:excisionase family DNA binding protein
MSSNSLRTANRKDRSPQQAAPSRNNPNARKHSQARRVTPQERDALRTYATPLPVGSAILVPREHLLALLGDAPLAGEKKDSALLTVPEVAQRLKVGKQTVYRKARQLGAVKVGRTVRFTAAGVAKYLERRRGS